jgi:uncharacterized OsmC-like protein
MFRNGIDVDLFQGWVDTVRELPETGTITATVRHRWDDGFAVDGQCEAFEEAGEVVARTQHTFRTDWPEPFGADSGPTPGAELLLASVGACVATTYIAKAASQGVAIDELEVITEGHIDLQGLLELSSVRAGFAGISMTLHVHSGADDAALKELGQTVTGSSPVYESLAKPVPMQLSVQRLTASGTGSRRPSPECGALLQLSDEPSSAAWELQAYAKTVEAGEDELLTIKTL